MLCILCREYHWTIDYIMKELTWGQVWLMYEHIIAKLNEKDVIYDEYEPPAFEGTQVQEDGSRVLNK